VGERVAATGMGTITPETGVAALERLLRPGIVHAGVLPVQNWSRLLCEYAAGSEPPFVSEIAQQTRAAGSVVTRQREVDLAARLHDAAPAERRRLVQAFIREQAVKVIALDPSQPIDSGQSLNELGLDSLMALELRNALGAGVKRTLPATVLFNYPSIDALTQYICRDILNLDEAVPHAASRESDVPMALDHLADNEMAAILAEKLAALATKDKERSDG